MYNNIKHKLASRLHAGIEQLNISNAPRHFSLYYFTSFGVVYSNPVESPPHEDSEHFWARLKPEINKLTDPNEESTYVVIQDAVVMHPGSTERRLIPRLILFTDDIKAITIGETDPRVGLLDGNQK